MVEPLGPLQRIRLRVSYHGAAFSGFARNDGVDTIAGRLEDALATVCRLPVLVTPAGRTDSGVHATGQVISADIPESIDLDGLVRHLNSLCAPHISVRDAAVVSASFDARFSARSRTYRYSVWNALEPEPMMVDRSWHVPRRLELASMRLAAAALVGTHDFTSMCRRRPGMDPAEPMPREVLSAEWTRQPGPMVTFDISGTAFCHQMVRSIVGLCVEVGTGRRRAGDVLAVLAARDRATSSPIAPAHGLCLVEVAY